jgi:SAM-dependent methyltransferase
MGYRSSKPSKTIPSTSWDPIARWYNGWVGKRGSRYHRLAALPTVLRLAELQAGERLLDLGCGQGVLAPHVLRAKAGYVGVDASRRLLALAHRHHGPQARFIHGDAAELATLGVDPESFDVAVFMLSIQDMQPLEQVLRAAGQALKRSGRLILFMVHPCFRVPRGSGWGFDVARKLSYRRVERYLRETAVPMKAYAEVTPLAKGTTVSFHRPLMTYVNALAASGLLLDRLEELPDPVKGEGSKADIPLFLALRARKAG